MESRTSARIARNVADAAIARAAADAGIQLAIYDFVATPPDIRKLRGDGTIYLWRFANSTIRMSVQDELDKINLNTAPEALLAALFGSVGVDPGTAQSLADSIADFRDADNLLRPRGAEEADYRAAGLAWGPKNAPFEGIEELQQVLGMCAAGFDKILGEPQSLAGKLVDSWRRRTAQLAATIGSEVAVADIVGEDEHDIGFHLLRENGRGGYGPQENDGQSTKAETKHLSVIHGPFAIDLLTTLQQRARSILMG